MVVCTSILCASFVQLQLQLPDVCCVFIFLFLFVFIVSKAVVDFMLLLHHSYYLNVPSNTFHHISFQDPQLLAFTLTQPTAHCYSLLYALVCISLLALFCFVAFSLVLSVLQLFSFLLIPQFALWFFFHSLALRSSLVVRSNALCRSLLLLWSFLFIFHLSFFVRFLGSPNFQQSRYRCEYVRVLYAVHCSCYFCSQCIVLVLVIPCVIKCDFSSHASVINQYFFHHFHYLHFTSVELLIFSFVILFWRLFILI